MKKLAALLVTPLVLASMSLAPTAHAATGSIKDKSGDAPAKLDVTKVKVSHTSTEVVITTKIRGLRKKDTQFYGYYLYGETTAATGTSHRSRKGKVEEEWYLRRSDGMLVPADCAATTTWNIKRSTIRTTIPRSCVPEAGTLQVKASTGPGTPNGDVSDVTKKVKVAQD